MPITLLSNSWSSIANEIRAFEPQASLVVYKQADAWHVRQKTFMDYIYAIFSSQEQKNKAAFSVDLQQALATSEQELHSSPSNEETVQQVQELFFSSLAKLPPQLFDRSSLLELPTLRQLLQSRDDEPARLIDRVEREARFALQLGLEPVAAGDASSSFFLRDLEGKAIAIFKPSDTGPCGKANLTLRGRIDRFFRKKILPPTALRASRHHISELLSAEISEALHLAITPPTKICRIQERLLRPQEATLAEKEGSFQVVVPNAQTLGSILSPEQLSFLKNPFQYIRSLFTKTPQHISLEKLADLAILDYMTGQVDRHFDNWMHADLRPVATLSTFQLQLSDALQDHFGSNNVIFAIDNGASFPKHDIPRLQHPFQYAWTALEQSTRPLPTQQLELLRNLQFETIQTILLRSFLAIDLQETEPNARQAAEQAIIDAVEHFDAADFPTIEEIIDVLGSELQNSTRCAKIVSQILLAKYRFQVLKIMTTMPDMTLRDLAAIISIEDMQAFIAANSNP